MSISDFPQPFTLLVDNSAAQMFMEDSGSNTRLKHIDLRQNWVKEMRDRDIVVPEHIPSADNLADTFTKPLPKTTFQHRALKMLDSKRFDWANETP